MPASRRSRRLLGTLTVAVLAITAAPANAAIVPTTATRDVVLIGNALAGTVSFLDGRTFANLGSLNVIPDLEQRLSAMTVIERAGYELVRSQLGDKFVDDMFLSPDGRTMYVSRANLADVVAIDLVSHQQRWRFKVEGIHADHMAISPDARRIVVSASTGQQAQVLDAATGALVGSFATGSYPHQNDYSNDGRRIYNSSIGVTSMPQLLEPLKGARQVTVVDSTTLRTVRTYTFDHGIRPSVFTPDEKIMYAQLSYLNGFIEYDLVQGRILRTVELPFSPQGAAMRPDDYPQNSAHHGLALSGDGGKLCAAGTIDDYVAIISRPGLTTDRLVPVPRQPYWAVTSVDGRHCVVSNSGDDSVSVVSYDTAQEVARVRVGQFPQRERIAAVAGEVLPTLSPAAG
jgi:DNA-binding beta-propeller fold protein YncE